ncbi:fumarylacetoacetate hydrolase family protein [Natronomonas sp. F2-12]|jgi:2-keto-4-pentenoate hydratase/2-oxohepta-3-ene-1,7-dioic acid hydratase in catechol pathway|uniref:Fumarylacetoacetate hydrolase family protein n=1 Tax=Natronomonas aquatica TaxID=2841590 RepID=A0A9R1CQB2_9EURY|nr:fumarylacetoacetate hydrolase family protein [Natronomonas aquatica]MCQ4332117.1 fumarylacetoacetate hydrolase family protein [Natronomonas aquatica]
MRYVRFRDPAGTVRRGIYGDSRLEAAGRSYDIDDPEIELLAPCEPSKIVCVGFNYPAHADEVDEEIPERPSLFFKTPNAVAPHGATIELLPRKEEITYEGELAVVIGEQCRNVDAADAENVVHGYTCMNDVTNRDDADLERNWVRTEAFDGSAPLGPAVATPEEVPEDASIELFLNGERRQAASIDELAFSVPELIEEITAYLTLEPGDVIATGTPSGTGELSGGDTVEIEIEGIGTLEHGVSSPDGE